MAVKINGTLVNADLPIRTTNKITDEKETGNFKIKFSTKKEAYTMFSEVELISDITEYFYIAEDISDIMTRGATKTYQHSTTLIEPMKITERVTLPTFTIRQPLTGAKLTLLDVLEKALRLSPYEDITNHAATRIYTINAALTLVLDTFISPQATFTKNTLFEVIKYVMGVMNAKPKMNGFTEIDADFYSKQGTLIDVSNLLNFQEKQNIDKYAQTLESYVENTIPENDVDKQAVWFPSKDGWASLRSDDARITDDNFTLDVEERLPIYQQLTFEIWAKVNYIVQLNGATGTSVIKVDVSELLYEYEAWSSLLYEYGIPDYSNNVAKNNTLYFRQGKNKIEGMHIEYDTIGLGTATQFRYLLSYAATKALGYEVRAAYLDARDKLAWRISYVPTYDNRIQITRPKVDALGVLFTNQDERIIDVEAMGTNFRAQAMRLSNKQRPFQKYVELMADVYHINERTADGFYITDVENTRYKDRILSSAIGTKDFVELSKRIGINSQYRETPIDKTSNAVQRIDIYNQYAEFSFTRKTDTSYLTTLGKQLFMRTLKDGAQVSYPVEYAVWHSILAGGTLDYTFVLACVSVGFANVMSFNFGFDNNISAGKTNEAVSGINGDYNVNQIYTEDDGTLDRMKFELANTYDNDTGDLETDLDNAVLYGNRLPVPNLAFITNQILDSEYFDIEKGQGDISSMNYQLNNVSDDPDNIIIGEKMATENILVKIKTGTDYYVYHTTESYTHFDKKVKGALSILPIVIDESAQSISVSSLGNKWAIGDGDGNLYLACNTSTNIIYVNFLDKRSE